MNKTLIVIVLAVGLLVATVVFLNKAKALKKGDVILNKINIEPQPTNFPVKIGDRGTAVKLIQAYCGVKVDGIFGSITQRASEEDFGSPNGEVTKRMFIKFLLDPYQIGGLDSFPMSRKSTYWLRATLYLQIMLGVTKDEKGVFGEETEAMCLAVFNKNEITYEDYKQLCFSIFNFNETDLLFTVNILNM